MIIKKFRKYVILCLGQDKITYRWHLLIEPEYKAWKVANMSINIGDIIKGYLILEIEDVTSNKYSFSEEDIEFWEKPISKGEFDFSVSTSNIGYAVDPIFETSYRCQLCGGIVANDFCTECMFDWDS